MEIEKFFDEERHKLFSYLYRITNNKADSEDLLQDTLIAVIEKKSQFDARSGFKTWVFSIATNKAIDHLRKEKRWAENVMDKAKNMANDSPQFFNSLKMAHQTSPHGAFEVIEHINLCFSCISKVLAIEKQVALLLKEIYGFTVHETAQIMDKTASQVKHYLEDARAEMTEIFDRRCALVNKNGVCHQCSELNGIFNPNQDTRQKLNEIKFVKGAVSKAKEELFDLRAELVKSIDPLISKGHKFQQKRMEFICKVAKGQ